MNSKTSPQISRNEVKGTTITTKLSLSDKAIIQQKAQHAGLTTSNYMRRTALGHKLYAALNPEELRLLRNLDGLRGDIINFANALHGMKNDKRMELFQNIPFMAQWYKKITPITNAVIEFLNSIYSLYGETFRKPKD